VTLEQVRREAVDSGIQMGSMGAEKFLDFFSEITILEGRQSSAGLERCSSLETKTAAR
jgi:hypothetical protein